MRKNLHGYSHSAMRKSQTGCASIEDSGWLMSVRTDHLGKEEFRVDGFDEDLEGVSLLRGRCEQVGGSLGAGEEDELARRAEGANADGGFDSGKAVHDDVEDGKVGWTIPGQQNGHFSAVGAERGEASDLEDRGEGVCDRTFIVHDQHGWTGVSQLNVQIPHFGARVPAPLDLGSLSGSRSGNW